MTTAVIYARVSSKAQLKKGDGLAGQESRCRDFATYRGYDVATQIEALRDTRETDAANAGIPLNFDEKEKAR